MKPAVWIALFAVFMGVGVTMIGAMLTARKAKK